jgi:PHS family inorganic phosphate transporter-like MFS transporter
MSDTRHPWVEAWRSMDSTRSATNRPTGRVVGQALDRATLGMFHYRAAVISGMGFFTDAYDLFIIGIAMVLLKPEWHLSTTQVSTVSSATLIAAFVGAMLFGRIADRIGRKRIYWMVSAIEVVGALASCVAPNLAWLVASRFLLGLGVGGDYPLSAVMMSEYANARDRGRLVGLVFSMQALGLTVGPVVGLTLVASGISHDIAWRIMLGLGALPAATVVYLRIRMPESPRFAEAVKGEGGIAAMQVRAFSDGAVQVDGEAEQLTFEGIGTEASDRRLRARNLFTNRRLLATLIGTAGTWFIFDYAYYGNTISTPLIMRDIAPHAALVTTLAWTLIIFSVFAVPGYILALSKMDRIGHRKLQAIGFSAMAVAFLAIGAFPSVVRTTLPFLLLYGVSYFFAEFGPNTTTFVLPAELFPISVRTTGHGISAGVAKLGAFIGVFVFPIISKSFGLRDTLLFTGAMSVAGLALTYLLSEPAGRTLDEIAGAHNQAGREATVSQASSAQLDATTATEADPALADPALADPALASRDACHACL